MTHRRLAPIALAAACITGGSLLTACASAPRTRPQPAHVSSAPIAPDTGVVIVGVRNFEDRDVAVYLDSQGRRWQIGTVPGMHESLFVLSSHAMGTVNRFVIAVIPIGTTVRSYQTDFITRTPGKVLVVGIQVGAGIDPDAPRPPHPRV
jgi:hypothetical protein